MALWATCLRRNARWRLMCKAGLMRRLWPELLATVVVLLLAATVTASANDAPRAAEVTVQPIDFGQVAKELDKGHRYALVIGISQFDNLPQLGGVADELTLVRAAFARQGFEL